MIFYNCQTVPIAIGMSEFVTEDETFCIGQ